jgi:glycosyltransferase involved in cell wall biosynthesis
MPSNPRRILMLTYISPLEKWGSAKRSHLLIDALRRHGSVEVLVIHFVDAAFGGPELEVGAWCGVPVLELHVPAKGLLARPQLDLVSDDVTQLVAKHRDLASYDLIVSRYVKPQLKVRLPAHVPLLVDFDDAIYAPPWQALKGARMWVGVMVRLLNDRVIARGRLRLQPHARSHYLFCREAERQAFAWLPSSVLPNLPPGGGQGIEPHFEPPPSPALMFIGHLEYTPNRDAVDWFLTAIWPQVRREVPAARFLIVGSGDPARLARWGAHDGVDALGFVDDLAATYRRATACVVPMRSGAGTNIKALEPYQYGRMVIATPLVVEGHEPLFTPGADVLQAADAPGFARHCVAMLQAPEQASQMARRGHDRIASVLSLDRFQRVLDAAVDAVTKDAAPLRDLSRAR